MQSSYEAILEAAYAEHRGALVRRLTVLCRDPEAAEDIAQEAFLRLVREVEAGRTPDSTGAWLHRVGANLATSRARRVHVATRHEAELPRPSEPASPECLVVDAELGSAVRALVETLPAHERQAVLLAATGVGGSEIAQSIGRTPGATRTLLCRARAKLRARLQLAGFAGA